jgi:hypothetical protein
MIFIDTYKDIIKEFGSLWQYKQRGETLEIITPFSTTSQKFVSVFLTERNGEYIVSDGGWLFEGGYENSLNVNSDCFDKIFAYYKNTFNIQEVENKGGIKYYYKKTDKLISIASLVFDLSNFISTIASTSMVKYDDKELETENTFAKKAKEFLNKKIKTKKSKNEIYYNEYFDSKRQVKVNAIIRKPSQQLVLLNFITGSTPDYFRSNISKTNLVFELAKKAKESQYVDSKIALLDNTAKGYNLDRISIWLDHLLINTQSEKVEWTNKKSLIGTI